MAIRELTRGTAAHFLDRIRALSPESERQWGSMTPAQMLRHLRMSFQASLSEIEIEDKSNLLFKLARPVYYSGLLRMPKGKVQAPDEYVVDSADPFETEQAALIEAIERFLALCEREPAAKPLHPVFGPMTIPHWQRGHAMHMEHHLEQFGA